MRSDCTRSISFFCILCLILPFFLAGCNNNDDTPSQEAPNFYLLSSADQLTEKYTDTSVAAVVELSFSEPVSIVSADGAGGLSQKDEVLTPVADGTLVRMLVKETLAPVEGNLYLSEDGTGLIFVPKEFLSPGTAYTVLVSAVIKSVDDVYLGTDTVFELTTEDSGAVVSIVADHDVILQGEGVTFSAESSMLFQYHWWVADQGTADSETSNDPTALFTYDNPGVYHIGLEVEDSYGRQASASREVAVFGNITNALAKQSAFTDVETVAPEDVQDETLAGLMGKYGDDTLAVVEADMSVPVNGGGMSEKAETGERLPLSEFLPGRPLVSMALRPDRAGEFNLDYIETLIGEGRFLGIVSFKGFPAIVSSLPYGDHYVLELLISEGDINLQYSDGTYDIDLKIPGMSPTPWIHKMSVPISEAVIGKLQTYLPKIIRSPLPVLYTSKGYYMLDSIEEVSKEEKFDGSYRQGRWNVGFSVNLGIVTVSASAGSSGVSADVDVDDTLVAIYNLLTGDLLDTLKSIKNFIVKVVSLNPFGYISDVKNGCVEIKDEFVSLYNGFSAAGSVLTNATDPALLVGDVRNFLYTGAGSSVKSVAAAAINVLNNTGGAFDLISQPLLAVNNASTYFSGFIPNLNTNAYVVFYVGTDSVSLKVKVGAVEKTVSLDTLNTFNTYASEVLDKVGADFPLSGIIGKFSSLQTAYGAAFAGEVGFYYDGGIQELKFLVTFYTGGSELAHLQVKLKPTETRMEVKVTNPLSSSTYVLLEFVPFNIPSPGDDVVDAMFEVLSFVASPFPEITMTVQTKYRDILAQITSRLRPAYSFQAYISLGEEINYAVVVGGKEKVSVQIYCSIDANAISSSVVKEAAKAAFQTCKSTIPQYFSTVTDADGKNGMMTFPDDKVFVSFLKDFFVKLKDELVTRGVATSLLSSITVGVSPSAEMGAGIGAGGTGTGGANANVTVGAAIDLNANLLFFTNVFLDYLKTQNISQFIMTPLADAMMAMNSQARDNPFDVKAAARILENTFGEIIGQLPAGSQTETQKFNAINSFFNNVAQNVNMGLSFQAGVDGELEEGANVQAGIALGASVSANGEFVMNALYPIVKKAFDMKGATATQKSRLIVLDQPGVFPKVSFALPLSGKIEAGFDEGIQVNIGLGAQMTYLSGSVSFQGDPFRTSAQGGITGTKMIQSYPVAGVSQSPATAARGATVTFTGSTTLETGTSVTDANWYVNGQEIVGTGNYYENGVAVLQVTSLSSTTLAFKPSLVRNFRIRYEVTDSKGRADYADTTFVTTNNLPTVPTVTLTSGSSIYVITPIPVSSSDADSDTITYNIQISTNSGFTNIVSDYTSSLTQIPLQGVAAGSTYYIRVRAYDGLGYSAWSTVKSFTVLAPNNLPTVPTVMLTSGASIFHSTYIPVSSSDADGQVVTFQIQISSNSTFTSIVYDYVEAGPQFPLRGVIDGNTYYMRVRAYDGVGYSGWSTVKSFTVIPEPVTLMAPLNGASFVYGITEVIDFEWDGAIDYVDYRIMIADNPNFTNPVIDDFSGGSGLYELFDANLEGLMPDVYYWKVAGYRLQGNQIDWGVTWNFTIKLYAPSLYDPAQAARLSYTQAVVFDVEDIPEASYYEYQYSTSSTFATSGGVVSGSTQWNAGTFAIGRYYWRARSWANGVASDWSATRYFDVVNNPPSSVVLSNSQAGGCINGTLKLTFNAIHADGGTLTYMITLLDSGFNKIKSYTTTSSPFTFNLAEGGYDFYVDIYAVDTMGATSPGWNKEDMLHVVTGDCPPPVPTAISPADGFEVGRDRVSLKVGVVSDPDGDPMDRYEFVVVAKEGKTIEAQSSNGVVSVSGLTKGFWNWTCRAVSKKDGEFQYSAYSKSRKLNVLDNKPPVTTNVNPSNCEVFAAGEEIWLEVSVNDSDDVFIGPYDFEYAGNPDFKSRLVRLWKEESPSVRIDPLAAGVYYWHAASYDPIGRGSFSETTCFSVIEKVAAPNIAEARNADSFGMGIDGHTTITFNALTRTTNCCGEFTGTLSYLIADNEEFNDAIDGDFINNVPFTVTLPPGNYYWKAKHTVAGIKSDWSEPLQFTITSENRRPSADNVTPAAGAVFTTVDAVTLTLGVTDPDGDPIASYDFQYDTVPGFTHPMESLGQASSSHDFGTLSAGIYYWRGRGSDAGGAGAWSAATCFSVIGTGSGSVATPTISGDDNPDSYEIDDGQVTLTFNVVAGTTNCLGNFTGTLEYEISINNVFDPPLGSEPVAFENRVPFNVTLAAGTYYWHVRHVVAGVASDWSNVLTFTVTEPPTIVYLVNENFESGIGVWTQTAGGVGSFVMNTLTDGTIVYHYARTGSGSNGGASAIEKAINTDITGYSEVYLEFDVKLISYTLPSSGWALYRGEWPAEAKIYFTDLDGTINLLWNHGFLSGTDSEGKTNYTPNIGFNWYHYTSPNLKTVKSTDGADLGNFIRTINTLALGGSGWDYEGKFDNVVLRCVP
ncbi:MAG: hypothetical protein NT072_11170 [Deltaproteobacteria bacterium]|nr:hypothetical protein [Deltaproteobacteria bacterium]